MQALEPGISYVDLTHLGRRRVIAATVVEGDGGVTLIDPGPASCLGALREALGEAGMAIADIRTILLTHIHLDHAGATGTLLRENPAITVYVHERGAPHMIDPEKLLASAARLYGEQMNILWGAFLPVPEASVRVLTGGERIEASGRRFDVAYTPGHAWHHVSFFERNSGIAFVGDVAGVRTSQATFVMPPTPPPDIDLDTWVDSIELIRAWNPSRLLITHFGPHADVAPHLDAAIEHLRAVTNIARAAIEAGGDDVAQAFRFIARTNAYIADNLPKEEEACYTAPAPLDQCWLGLARYWKKQGVTAP